MAAPDPQTVEFTITKSDLRRFMSYHTLHHPPTRNLMLVVYAGLIIYFAHLAYTMDFGRPAVDPRSWTIPEYPRWLLRDECSGGDGIVFSDG